MGTFIVHCLGFGGGPLEAGHVVGKPGNLAYEPDDLVVCSRLHVAEGGGRCSPLPAQYRADAACCAVAVAVASCFAAAAAAAAAAACCAAAVACCAAAVVVAVAVAVAV